MEEQERAGKKKGPEEKAEERSIRKAKRRFQMREYSGLFFKLRVLLGSACLLASISIMLCMAVSPHGAKGYPITNVYHVEFIGFTVLGAIFFNSESLQKFICAVLVGILYFAGWLLFVSGAIAYLEYVYANANGPLYGHLWGGVCLLAACLGLMALLYGMGFLAVRAVRSIRKHDKGIGAVVTNILAMVSIASVGLTLVVTLKGLAA